MDSVIYITGAILLSLIFGSVLGKGLRAAETRRNGYLDVRARALESAHLARSFDQPAAKGFDHTRRHTVVAFRGGAK